MIRLVLGSPDDDGLTAGPGAFSPGEGDDVTATGSCSKDALQFRGATVGFGQFLAQLGYTGTQRRDLVLKFEDAPDPFQGDPCLGEALNLPQEFDVVL